MIKPPLLRTLLEDPMFRKYMKTRPALPANLAHGNPWAVFIRMTSGKWMQGKFPTYERAWSATVKYMRKPGVDDVSLVSRRRLFMPTRMVEHLIEYPYTWCVRCRRPSSFEQFTRHHAIPKNVPLDDAAPRCVFCGMRPSV